MSYKLGDYVQLSKKRRGYIRFEGTLPNVGNCYGIELDQKEKEGTDGSVDGDSYFQCTPGYGIFVKNTRILSKLKSKKKRDPPPIATQSNGGNSTNNKSESKNTKNGSIKKSKSKRLKSPRKDAKKRPKSPNHEPNTTSTKSADKYRRGKLKHTATPRPRAGTRDPRQLMNKKPSATVGPSTATKISKKGGASASYPEDGTLKEQLQYLFTVIPTTKTSKGKIELLKKTSGIIADLNCKTQDEMQAGDLVTPSFIIKEFKNIFEALLKDKKFAVHREALKLFNSLILCEFTRQGMVEQMVFSMKLLTNQLTHSNVKTVNAAKASIKYLIHEVLLEDNNKLLKVMMIEVLRFAKTSKKKIIRKYCWLCVADILEAKYNVAKKKAKVKKLKIPQALLDKQEEKKESKPVEQEQEQEQAAEEEEKAPKRVITKKKKPPKAIMDALSVALKIGLNDRDKEVQLQAMKILSLFSLLEETKADRLISKMSTSTRKLFDSKYGDKQPSSPLPPSTTRAPTKARVRARKAKTPGKRQRGDKKGNSKKKDKAPKMKEAKKRKSFTLKEDPAPVSSTKDKGAKKGSGGKKSGGGSKKKGKQTSTTERTKSPKKGDKKAPKKEKKSVKKKGDKKTVKSGNKKGAKKNVKGDKKGEKKKAAPAPPETTESKTETETTDKATTDDIYGVMAIQEDAEEEDEDDKIDITELRKRRRDRRNGSKQRSAGAFGTGDQDFDVSNLNGLIPDEDEEEEELIETEDGSAVLSDEMNAGMNGDVRKDGADEEEEDPYSSSTETYEGDNDIEIYEFPRKDALDGSGKKNGAEFTIDIDRYLSNNNPEYNWKFGNEEMIFFSHKRNTHLLMSRISQIEYNKGKKEGEINYDDAQMGWMDQVLQYEVDYNDLSLIRDTSEFWPTDIDADYMRLIKGDRGAGGGGKSFLNGGDDDEEDASTDEDEALADGDGGPTPNKHEQHEYIVATQISYNLMRLLTNEHGSDWIKQFIEECIYEITVHALCVFHPLSSGNVYHGRVILEVLLNHFPRDFFKYLVEDDRVIQPLLQYAIFNNIHHGNLNSFVMDLICFDPESIQQRDDIMFHQKQKMTQEITEYKQHLLKNVFCDEWKFIEGVMKRACSKYCDDVSTKYSVFFVDLVARCASIEETKCLFEEQSDRIIDSFVNGLLGDGDSAELNFWQRIRCGQSLVEYLDLASRPTIMDPSIAATPFGFMQAQNAYKENIFYASFKYCLARLIQYIPDLCDMISGEEAQNKSPHPDIHLSYGHVTRPLGRLKLNALELLTVTIDFHEMNCSLVLKEIPDSFWNKIVEMAFSHKFNNMFLCHFRRLVHLAMIFRRRILKYLCVECKMVDRMVDFYQKQHEHRSELHGYILQMLNDIYCHDSEIKHIQ